MEKLICLVIDDDMDDRDFFLEALKLCCPEVQCEFAQDCDSAVDKLSRGLIDIPKHIFIDWKFQNVDITNSVKQLKTLENIKESNIFILAAAVPPIPLATIQKAGIKDILLKQNSIKELADELSAVIS